MSIIPKELFAMIPKPNYINSNEDNMVYVKFVEKPNTAYRFNPITYYIAEYDENTEECWGYVIFKDDTICGAFQFWLDETLNFLKDEYNSDLILVEDFKPTLFSEVEKLVN